MDWEAPPRPAELTESRLIEAILDGLFPIDSHLPAERDLASQLGVTRPTLREALQRMARDGWLEINHGKPTRVRDYWTEGSLGVLGAIARNQQNLPPDFIPNLLHVRLLLAPTYARLAAERQPDKIIRRLQTNLAMPDDPATYARADFELHRQLAVSSGNPVFTLILNGFEDLYLEMGQRYFSLTEARQHSRQFYQRLLDAARTGDLDEVEAVTRTVIDRSQSLWEIAQQEAR
jgi:GntR family negative regulator for fad regulon and positive regulator of fabA